MRTAPPACELVISDMVGVVIRTAGRQRCNAVSDLDPRQAEVLLSPAATGGVQIFSDTVAAFDRWQRGGLKLAAISAGRDCRQVLQAFGQLARFDTVVDGQTAAAEEMQGETRLIAAVLSRLGVPAARAVLLENTPSGVAAGCEQGCGLVVGVDRGGQGTALERAGAHVVIQDVSRLRFARRLPDARERRDGLRELRAGRPLCVFLDFDGTLSPIVGDPSAATITPGMRAAVEALARHHTVAIVSGRDRADVQARVALDGLIYVGSHGLDIGGRGHAWVHPGAAAAVAQVEATAARLGDVLAGIDGAIIETKRFSVAVHYRLASEPDKKRVRRIAAEVLAAADRLIARRGKQVVELVPDLAWDKGRAVAWLLASLAIDSRQTQILYLGDDETDEDAFAALAGLGLGIRVGPAVCDSLADYRLPKPEAVQFFLTWLVEG